MNKKVVVVIIVVVGAMCAGFCGLAGLGVFAGVKGYQTAEANIGTEITPILTKVLTSYDNTEYRVLLTRDAVADQPEAATQAKLDAYSKKYGLLKSLGKPQMTNMNSSTNNGFSRQSVTVRYDATFEHGDAEVNTTMIKTNGAWKIESLSVN